MFVIVRYENDIPLYFSGKKEWSSYLQKANGFVGLEHAAQSLHGIIQGGIHNVFPSSPYKKAKKDYLRSMKDCIIVEYKMEEIGRTNVWEVNEEILSVMTARDIVND